MSSNTTSTAKYTGDFLGICIFCDEECYENFNPGRVYSRTIGRGFYDYINIFCCDECRKKGEVKKAFEGLHQKF